MSTRDSLEPDPVNLFEFEEKARRLIGKTAFDYYVSGANDEITLRENRSAFERLIIHPYMLRDVSKREMQAVALGTHIRMPIMIAPMAFHKLAHKEGETAVMAAANSMGTIMVLSTLSSTSIEEVAAISEGNLWFQLYIYRDRKLTASLVERAEKAGCKALVFTVDSPILGRRENDIRNGFSLPADVKAANLSAEGIDALPGRIGESSLAHYIASLYDQSLNWNDLKWLRSISSLPVLVKGILRADDAEQAVQYGASGIIVSNHGGRQLDTAPATISVLKKVVQAVDGRVEVYVDGGIRRGTDVLKALALGARAVFVGRPVLWGLACGGQAGVLEVLQLLKDEFDLSMALSGCRSLQEIRPDLLAP